MNSLSAFLCVRVFVCVCRGAGGQGDRGTGGDRLLYLHWGYAPSLLFTPFEKDLVRKGVTVSNFPALLLVDFRLVTRLIGISF